MNTWIERPKYNLPFILFLIVVTTPGCFVRRRAAVPAASKQTRPLLTATKNELVQLVHDTSDPVQSFILRADLSPSVLDPSKGSATDYATVSANILFRKPNDIRILGQDPVMSFTIFDMVANGEQFRVSIPRKKRFVMGNNDAPATSQNRLENLRPAALLHSLMINPPQAGAEITALESDTELALYILLIIRQDAEQVLLARSISFDRHTLQIVRQKAFDPAGNVVSDTRYSGWKIYGGVPFPSEIDIQRPRDNYEVQLSLVTIRLNTPDVTPEKFTLAQPPNAQLDVLK